MIEWIGWLRAVAGRQPAALLSVLATEGSAPRGAGTRMVVTADALLGTIGGGQLEFRAIGQARALLDHPPGCWRVQDYPLGPLLGQCCGGRVRLLVEHVDPATLGWIGDAIEGATLVTTLTTDAVARSIGDVRGERLSARDDRPGAGAILVEPLSEQRRPLYLFGAGHVGQAIARHAERLPLRLAWFDTRPDLAAIEGVTVMAEDQIALCVAEAPADAAILILTHDHALDYRLTHAALSRDPATAFVGLIGSATKRARFLSRLERDGIGEAMRARLTSPIGMAGIVGKEPDVIAVSALAQILQLERRP